MLEIVGLAAVTVANVAMMIVSIRDERRAGAALRRATTENREAQRWYKSAQSLYSKMAELRGVAAPAVGPDHGERTSADDRALGIEAARDQGRPLHLELVPGDLGTVHGRPQLVSDIQDEPA